MKKLTSLVMACIFAISCLTSCSWAEENSDNVASSTTTVTTVTTTTTVPESVPESTTTTTETVTSSMKETETTTSENSTETTTTTIDNSKTTTKETTTQSVTKATTTTTKATTKETTKATTKTPEPTGNRVVLDVKNIQMLPELPCGSEVTSAVMLLNYYGFNINKMDFINYLAIDEEPDSVTGTWADPYLSFVGHPTKNGYGCYDTVIMDAIDKYFISNNINDYYANNRFKGMNNYIKEIQNGNPVLLWITHGLENVKAGDTWLLENGNEVTWIKNMYCVVMIGYDLDKNTVIISDPTDSKAIIELPKDKVENNNFMCRGLALVIHKDS